MPSTHTGFPSRGTHPCTAEIDAKQRAPLHLPTPPPPQGYTLFASAFIGGPLTGAALNPARVLGPALIYNCYWSAQYRCLPACLTESACMSRLLRTHRLPVHYHRLLIRALPAGMQEHGLCLHHRPVPGRRRGGAAGPGAVRPGAGARRRARGGGGVGRHCGGAGSGGQWGHQGRARGPHRHVSKRLQQCGAAGALGGALLRRGVLASRGQLGPGGVTVAKPFCLV